MIDDDDVVVWAWLMPTNLAGVIVWLVVGLFLFATLVSDRDECARRHCAAGAPRVVHGERVCVQRAVP